MFRILRAFINIVVGVIELLLTFRLIFEFLVVNKGTPFVAWLYGVTAPLVAPFAKILPNWEFSGFVVNFATVAAIIGVCPGRKPAADAFSLSSQSGCRV